MSTDVISSCYHSKLITYCVFFLFLLVQPVAYYYLHVLILLPVLNAHQYG